MIRPEPRWETPRTPSRQTFGPQVLRHMDLLGTPAMRHQRELALRQGELVVDEETGRLIPAAREVGWTVPRQSGKTTLLLSCMTQRATGDPWRGRQRIMYSAQDGRAAREKLLDDHMPLLESRRRQLGISRLYRGVGNEQVRWANGSLLGLLSGTSDSGHGKTLNLGAQDELMADVDARRDQAMVPAMNTIADAQVLRVSTAGTVDSATWNAVVARGRRAAEDGRTTDVVWQEYSAPPDCDPEDERVWMACMPALRHAGNPGGTISLAVVRHAFMTFSLGEFKRAYLNIPTGSLSDDVFGGGVWARGSTLDGFVPSVRMSLAVDIRMDRGCGYLAAADHAAPAINAAVIGDFPGLVGMVDACVDLWRTWRIPFQVDAGGPAGAVAAELQGRGVGVELVTTRDYAAWCGSLFDAVTAAAPSVRHVPHEALDDAADALRKRKASDAFVWDRTAPVDPSPLIAVTLARGRTASTAPLPNLAADIH